MPYHPGMVLNMASFRIEHMAIPIPIYVCTRHERLLRAVQEYTGMHSTLLNSVARYRRACDLCVIKQKAK